jgi:hypothetical protein
MAKKAKRREWTKDDVCELKTLARQKTPVAKIVKSLKRTAGATQQKAFSLGVSLDAWVSQAYRCASRLWISPRRQRGFRRGRLGLTRFGELVRDSGD